MKETEFRFDPDALDASGITVDDIISEVHAENGDAPRTAPRPDLSELLEKFGVAPEGPAVPPAAEPAEPETEIPPVFALPVEDAGAQAQDSAESFDIRDFEPNLDEDDYPDPEEDGEGEPSDEEWEDGGAAYSHSGGLFSRETFLLLFSSLAAMLLIGIAVGMG